jgi:hypothetical protein
VENLRKEKKVNDQEDASLYDVVLYDIVHEKIYYPYFCKWSISAQDFFCKMLDVSIHVSIALVLFCGFFFHQDRDTGLAMSVTFATFMKDYLNLLSIIFLVRSVSINLTILPQCDFRSKKAVDEKDKSEGLKKVWKLLTMQSVEFGYKNDLLFSGHSAFLILSSLMIHHFTTIYYLLKIMIWIICILLTLGFPCSMKHYTVDVLFAWITTLFIFQNYHNLLGKD